MPTSRDKNAPLTRYRELKSTVMPGAVTTDANSISGTLLLPLLSSRPIQAVMVVSLTDIKMWQVKATFQA